MVQEGTSENLKKVLGELLALEGISLDDESPSDEEGKVERYGDYSQMIKKSEAMLDDLNERAEELYGELGMSREELLAYGENPDNFSKEQWAALQKIKQEADALKNRSRESLGADVIEESTKTQKSKGRARFGKKKKWTPV